MKHNNTRLNSFKWHNRIDFSIFTFIFLHMCTYKTRWKRREGGRRKLNGAPILPSTPNPTNLSVILTVRLFDSLSLPFPADYASHSAENKKKQPPHLFASHIGSIADLTIWSTGQKVVAATYLDIGRFAWTIYFILLMLPKRVFFPVPIFNFRLNEWPPRFTFFMWSPFRIGCARDTFNSNASIIEFKMRTNKEREHTSGQKKRSYIEFFAYGHRPPATSHTYNLHFIISPLNKITVVYHSGWESGGEREREIRSILIF